MVKIALKDILWVEAYDNYSFHYYAGPQIPDQLYPERNGEPNYHYNAFVRTHRSYIVNLEKVEAFEENPLIMNEKSIPIGKSFRKELMTKFNII
jgi:DNA-binding LytR/AlgR family response regulator